MDLLFYVRVLRKGWWLILLCALLATAASVVATARATPVYEASTKLYVAGQPGGDAAQALATGSLSQQRIASYADLVVSTPAVDEVLNSLGESPRGVEVTAAPLESTLILVVSVKADDPQRAARIANGFGATVPALISRTEQPPGGALSPIKASVTQPAVVPTSPTSPNPTMNTALGLVLGLLIGGAFALLKEMLDTSVKSPEDLERTAPGLPLLGAIFFDAQHERHHLVTATQPRSPRAEAFRQLRTNVRFAEIDSGLRSFVVTSALPSEGKSTVSANLAIALAQAGQRVILVEADLRRPSLAEFMGFERAVGLTSVLIGQVALEDALQDFGAAPGLVILPGGPIPPNPSEILGSQAMNDLLRRLESIADIVIFDSPPLLPVTDAAVLAAQTSGALLVVRANRTTRTQLLQALKALDAVGAHAIGAALNFVKAKELSGYGYGVSYRSRSGVQRLEGSLPDVTPLQGGASQIAAERARTPAVPAPVAPGTSPYADVAGAPSTADMPLPSAGPPAGPAAGASDRP